MGKEGVSVWEGVKDCSSGVDVEGKKGGGGCVECVDFGGEGCDLGGEGCVTSLDGGFVG